MTRKTFWELARYVFVGLLGAVVDFGTFYALTRFAGWNPVAANVVSVLLGIVHNFIWHKYFTFRIKSRERIHAEFVQYFVVAGVSYVIQEIGLPLGLLLPLEHIRIIGSHEDLVVKIFWIGVIGFSSYFVNRAWTFKHRDGGVAHRDTTPAVLP